MSIEGPGDSSHPASSSTTASHDESEAELIRLTRRCVDLFNAREYDFANWSDFVSPDVRINCNNQQIGTGYAAFIDAYRRDADINPDFSADVSNITIMVNDAHGTATTVSSHVHENFVDQRWQGLRRATTVLCAWRRIADRWWLQSCSLINGTSEYID